MKRKGVILKIIFLEIQMIDDNRKLDELTVGDVKILIRQGVWQAVKWWVLVTIGLPVLAIFLIGLFGYIMYPK